MRVESLQKTMNAISGILASGVVLSPSDKPSKERTPAPADELEALASFDPLLASLRGEYKAARAQRLKSEQDFGKDSPMSEVARDMEDSSWCAMQTRYIELQSDNTLRKKAQTLLLEEERKEKARQRKEEQENWLRFLAVWQLVSCKLREAQNKETNTFFLLVLSMLFMRTSSLSGYGAGYHFNRIAV